MGRYYSMFSFLRANVIIANYSPYSGLQLTGNEEPFTVGSDLQLNCSSDLAILTAEWLYDGMVITQNTAGEAILEIPAVNDSLHNRQFTCRVATPFGVQERNTTITVTSQ